MQKVKSFTVNRVPLLHKSRDFIDKLASVPVGFQPANIASLVSKLIYMNIFLWVDSNARASERTVMV